ncbi:MAG: CheR family methyltransferase [Acidobacteriota bacterium]
MTHEPDGLSTRESSDALPSLIVGVGASAGGLAACQQLLRGAPSDQGIAFVIVVHLAPAEESHVAGILQRVTRMPVSQAATKVRVEPNHVYVIAPATSLDLRDGFLEAGAPKEPHYLARPIDDFFASLAAGLAARAVGIVLSGTGDDGSAGIRAIRARGGLCLVQAPGTAEYDGMPRNAIDTGAADAVVAPEEMGALLGRYAATPQARPGPQAGAPPETGEPGASLSAIVELLGERYRVDFRDYKTGTLIRRTERRMGVTHRAGWASYLQYLREHPEEVDALYSDLLIGVTSFFRDPEEWEFLAREIVPSLIEGARNTGSVRVWSAGCATGEEAYSLAMIFLEQIQAAGSPLKLKVFASDASDAALVIARQGRYAAGIAEQVSAERLRRFFRRTGEGFEVERAVRDTVTFASHDAQSDPPFARLDLMTCRNVLIYLEAPAQEELLERFHFALRPRGVLWLGAAETVGRRADLFEEMAGKHKLYRSLGLARPGAYRLARLGAATNPAHARQAGGVAAARMTPRLLEKLILERHTSPCVVVDQALDILYFFGPSESYLTRPQGEAKLNLLSWVRPELYAKLRTGLSEAMAERRAVTVRGLRIERDKAPTRVEIAIEPLTAASGAEGFFLVAFRDVASAPEPQTLQSEGGESGDRDSLIGDLRQELQDTRDELRTAVDQLRTATEEHTSSYEELLSLNEEFQSSHEEIEASQEELQSLNEELTTINRQLEDRNQELRTLTSDLNNLLVSTNVPTVFLDRNLCVRRSTPACTGLMRIVPADVGRPLTDIKTQVRDDNLLADASRVLGEGTPIEAEVSTDDDRWFSRTVLPYRTDSGEIDGVCLTYHEMTVQKKAAAASEYARLYAEAIIRTSRTALLVLDADHRLVSANEAFYTAFQVEKGETEGRRIYELGNGQWDIPRVRHLLEETLLGRTEIRDYDVEHEFEKIGWRSMRLNADVMSRDGRGDLILVSIEDVTNLRRAEIRAQSRADELELDDRRKDEFLAMLGHELRNPVAALSNGIELLRLTDGAGVERVRAMMGRQTRRMTAMLDQLLDVARVISGKFELTRDEVDIAEAAMAAIETARPVFESAGHELAVFLPPPRSVLVLGDALRIAQVIENLLGNAAKYTEKGGRICLRVEGGEETVTLSVKDTGLGLDPAMLERIFELFAQVPVGLHRAKGGLGLGLALVRGLVQMHGGNVEAFSAGAGQGTEVVVTLPRLHPRQLRMREDEGAALPAVTSRRVLVVDDEVDAAQTLVEILSLQGHDARAANDGSTALAMAQGFRPEVALLDLGLPGMDGYALAAGLRETLGRQVLLLAVTGYQEDRPRLREAGFDGHLLKPTTLEKLSPLMMALDRQDASGAENA